VKRAGLRSEGDLPPVIELAVSAMARMWAAPRVSVGPDSDALPVLIRESIGKARPREGDCTVTSSVAAAPHA